MIFCISTISRLYLEPIDHYEPDSIHIFIGNGKDAVSNVTRKVYESSKGSITCKNITEHRIDTSDYNIVLGEIIELINDLYQRYGKDLDVFINISSGTPEFSAAGMFASMLPQSAIAFRVDSECSMSPEELSEIMNRLNDSVKLSEPERVTGLKNDRPDDEMVVFLKVVSDILKETKYPKYRTIIERLKEEDSWSYDPDKKTGYGRTSLQEKEERYLKRHYIAIALENGWLERPSPNTMRLTDSGRAYISVYGSESIDRDACICANRYESAPLRKMEMCFDGYRSMDYMDYDFERHESSTVTFCGKKKKYTFTIEMDQHR